MSTSTLLRSTSHPPCPQDQEIVEISVPIDRTQLALTDRLSLRFGLWLLLRAGSARRRQPRTITHEQMMLLRENQRTMERQALAMLTYGLQRFPR